MITFSSSSLTSALLVWSSFRGFFKLLVREFQFVRLISRSFLFILWLNSSCRSTRKALMSSLTSLRAARLAYSSVDWRAGREDVNRAKWSSVRIDGDDFYGPTCDIVVETFPRGVCKKSLWASEDLCVASSSKIIRTILFLDVRLGLGMKKSKAVGGQSLQQREVQ